MNLPPRGFRTQPPHTPMDYLLSSSTVLSSGWQSVLGAFPSPKLCSSLIVPHQRQEQLQSGTPACVSQRSEPQAKHSTLPWGPPCVAWKTGLRSGVSSWGATQAQLTACPSNKAEARKEPCLFFFTTWQYMLQITPYQFTEIIIFLMAAASYSMVWLYHSVSIVSNHGYLGFSYYFL